MLQSESGSCIKCGVCVIYSIYNIVCVSGSVVGVLCGVRAYVCLRGELWSLEC